MFKDALLISIPVVIKAHLDKDGKRMVEVEASCEAVDLEGDVIEQKALTDSADTFIKSGHLDIDHLSEIGHRLGIRNPESFIVGRPTEVRDIGSKRTAVVGEIRRAADGVHNPNVNRYDAFWDSMHSDPPVLWRASIYGFPPSDSVIDCTREKCASGATRYHIKAIDWKSLAFTRNPINDSIKGFAKVITAKAAIEAFWKTSPIPVSMMTEQPPMIPHFDMRDEANGYPYDGPAIGASGASEGPANPQIPMVFPRSLGDAIGQYHAHIRRDCPHSGGYRTTPGFIAHFKNCCGMPDHLAELFGHALMHHLMLERRRVA